MTTFEQAERLHIIARRKFPPGRVAGLHDFILQRSAKPHTIQFGQHNTPYCLDDHREQVVFARTAPDIDLNAAPFLFRAQYEHADGLTALPYCSLHQTTRGRAAPERPIFIFGMGRAGTTLVTKALHQLPEVVTFSEPDVFTQMVALRAAGRMTDTALSERLRDCVLALYQPYTGRRLVIKFRSFVTENIDLFHSAFPDAISLFLHREPVAWVASNQRLLTRFHLPDAMLRTVLRRLYTPYLPMLNTLNLNALTLPEVLAHMWQRCMDRYQYAVTSDLNIYALSYEDLTADPVAQMTQILKHCDLPATGLNATLSPFETDSQAGSFLSRANLTRSRRVVYSDNQIASIKAITQTL